MGERATCPRCGGIVEDVGQGHTAGGALRDRSQTAHDQDQVASDQDQASSDRDQAGSDRDQRIGDDDQLTSPVDHVADGHSAAHGRSAPASAHESPDRDGVSQLGDEAAWATSEAAEDRDRAADLRDRGAEGRDLQARMREVRHDDQGSAEEILLRAGRDRAKAADDRAKAAADRTSAAAERKQAAHDRADALRAQAESRHDAHHNLMLIASDELTGALTREFGLSGVSHELDRASRSGGTLVLAAIDVDGLDEVKHTLGQAGADRLLRFVGDSLKANIRSYDLIVRYREDEFLCVMPSITRLAATKRLATVAAVLTAADKRQAITFGVAEYERADELPDLLGRTNVDLLAARRASGRE
jgi:diguanylate cyclase (GGDEF)-like protein